MHVFEKQRHSENEFCFGRTRRALLKDTNSIYGRRNCEFLTYGSSNFDAKENFFITLRAITLSFRSTLINMRSKVAIQTHSIDRSNDQIYGLVQFSKT